MLAFLSILAQEKTTRRRQQNSACTWDKIPRIFTILHFRVPIDSSSRKNDTKTTTKFCLHLGWNKSNVVSARVPQRPIGIGELCVDKIQSPRIGEPCVDKIQSPQICNLCVAKNPRPRRAQTNPGRTQLLIGKSIIDRFSHKKTPRPKCCAKKKHHHPLRRVDTGSCRLRFRESARPRLPQQYPAGDS